MGVATLRCALLVLVTGCQIIINHQNFEPADAAVDGGDDATVDPPPPFAEALVGTSANFAPVAIVAGRVSWTNGTPQLVASTPGLGPATKRGKNDVSIAIDSSLFKNEAGTPTCVCRSEGTGAEAHDCNLVGHASTGEVRMISWSSLASPPDYPISFVCTGIALTGNPTELSWPGQGRLVLASARIAVDGSVAVSSGEWIDESSATSGVTSTALLSGFSQAPACLLDAVGTGNFGARIRSVSATGFSADTWKVNETATPSFAIALCAGPGTGGGASRVVSPDLAGTVLGSVDPTDGTGGGAWSASFDEVSTGIWEEVPRTGAQPFFVAGEPHCICTMQRDTGDTRSLACTHESVPTSTVQRFRVFDASTKTLVGGLRPNLVCIAPRAAG